MRFFIIALLGVLFTFSGIAQNLQVTFITKTTIGALEMEGKCSEIFTKLITQNESAKNQLTASLPKNKNYTFQVCSIKDLDPGSYNIQRKVTFCTNPKLSIFDKKNTAIEILTLGNFFCDDETLTAGPKVIF